MIVGRDGVLPDTTLKLVDVSHYSSKALGPTVGPARIDSNRGASVGYRRPGHYVTSFLCSNRINNQSVTE